MSQSIIFFDGVCNLCNGFVQFIIARDTRNVFTFCSLQSEKAKQMLAPFHIEASTLSTVILLQGRVIYTQSTAALRILKELHGWRWTYAFIIVPRRLRDFIYDVIATYRYAVFGKRDKCMVPIPELREKFIA